MLITLVIDSYQDKSNGVAMTTERFANVFIELGHEVQIIAGQVDSKGKLKGISLGVSKVPVLYQVSKMQGFYFAKCKRKAIKEAILKSDVVINIIFLQQRLFIYCQKISHQLSD